MSGAEKTFLEEVRKNKNYDIHKSWQWYQANIRQLATSRGFKSSDMFKQELRQQRMLSPGTMYQFYYSAKNKDTLPYYDKFPLLLPFGVDDKHFIGLNLHYLGLKYRLVLFHKLLQFNSDKTLSENARFELNWKVLSNAAKLPEVKPCVKQYLNGYVKSMFLTIPPKDYITALYLPTESFTTNNTRVWDESSRILRGKK